MFTYAHYITNRCTSSQYYRQFVAESTLSFAQRMVEKYDLATYLEETGDGALNDPKVPRDRLGNWEWDCTPIKLGLLLESGCFDSLSIRTCIGKEAARMIIQGEVLKDAN